MSNLMPIRIGFVIITRNINIYKHFKSYLLLYIFYRIYLHVFSLVGVSGTLFLDQKAYIFFKNK